MSLLERELNQTRPIDDPTTEAILSVLKSGDVIQRELEAAVAEHGLTWQQYTVLRILRGAGPKGLPVLDIANHLIEGSPNVTRLLDRLVAKGLAIRSRAQHDKRVVYAVVTAAGGRLLDQLSAPVLQARRSICGSLTPTELDRLVNLLEKMRRGVYAQRTAAD